MAENEAFSVPMGIVDRNTIFMDGMFSHMTSVSPQSNSLVLNNQNQIVAEFPALSMLQGETINNRHIGFTKSNHVDLVRFDASISHDYSDALDSALATSVNSGYDGILSNINHQWDFDKFLPCLEADVEVPQITGFPPFQLVGNVNVDPDGWTSSNNANLSADHHIDSSKFSNELSLSLASCQPSIIHVPCSLNERQFGSETSSISENLSLSFGSRRPVQLSQILSGPQYLHVIQEILAEIASHSFSSSCLSDRGYAYALMGSDGNGRCEVQMDLVSQRREVEAKKKQLLALLQLVDEQFNQCLDEIHTVVSAFHAATELDPHVHARFALRTISSLYKNLRERISKQILTMGGDTREDQGKSLETSFIHKQWSLQQLRRKDHQLWRPQRGLPERSVSVLRAWMFQNFLHPYPRDAEKHLLALKSGLTRSQVSNWFINARVRLWKPMIEEMYAEMNRRKGRRNDEEADNSQRSQLSNDCRRLSKKR